MSGCSTRSTQYKILTYIISKVNKRKEKAPFKAFYINRFWEYDADDENNQLLNIK